MKHLLVEYRNWIQRKSPFPSVADELASLAPQGGHRLIEPRADDPLYGISPFLLRFDRYSASESSWPGGYRRA